MKIGPAKLAKVLGVPVTEIPQLVRAGMPSEKTRFGVAEALVWYVRYLRDWLERSGANVEDKDRDALHAERQRLVRAQADRAEAELKAANGTLLEAEVVGQIFHTKLNIVRSAILYMPARYSHRLEGCEEKEIAALLLRATEELLCNLLSSVTTLREERKKNGTTSNKAQEKESVTSPAAI